MHKALDTTCAAINGLASPMSLTIRMFVLLMHRYFISRFLAVKIIILSFLFSCGTGSDRTRDISRVSHNAVEAGLDNKQLKGPLRKKRAESPLVKKAKKHKKEQSAKQKPQQVNTANDSDISNANIELEPSNPATQDVVNMPTKGGAGDQKGKHPKYISEGVYKELIGKVKSQGNLKAKIDTFLKKYYEVYASNGTYNNQFSKYCDANGIDPDNDLDAEPGQSLLPNFDSTFPLPPYVEEKDKNVFIFNLLQAVKKEELEEIRRMLLGFIFLGKDLHLVKGGKAYFDKFVEKVQKLKSANPATYDTYQKKLSTMLTSYPFSDSTKGFLGHLMSLVPLEKGMLIFRAIDSLAIHIQAENYHIKDDGERNKQNKRELRKMFKQLDPERKFDTGDLENFLLGAVPDRSHFLLKRPVWNLPKKFPIEANRMVSILHECGNAFDKYSKHSINFVIISDSVIYSDEKILHINDEDINDEDTKEAPGVKYWNDIKKKFEQDNEAAFETYDLSKAKSRALKKADVDGTIKKRSANTITQKLFEYLDVDEQLKAPRYVVFDKYDGLLDKLSGCIQNVIGKDGEKPEASRRITVVVYDNQAENKLEVCAFKSPGPYVIPKGAPADFAYVTSFDKVAPKQTGGDAGNKGAVKQEAGAGGKVKAIKKGFRKVMTGLGRGIKKMGKGITKPFKKLRMPGKKKSRKNKSDKKNPVAKQPAKNPVAEKPAKENPVVQQPAKKNPGVKKSVKNSRTKFNPYAHLRHAKKKSDKKKVDGRFMGIADHFKNSAMVVHFDKEGGQELVYSGMGYKVLGCNMLCNRLHAICG